MLFRPQRALVATIVVAMTWVAAVPFASASLGAAASPKIVRTGEHPGTCSPENKGSAVCARPYTEPASRPIKRWRGCMTQCVAIGETRVCKRGC